MEVDDILSLLVLVDPGNEAATPEDETKLGDVARDDDEAITRGMTSVTDEVVMLRMHSVDERRHSPRTNGTRSVSLPK